MEKNDLRKSTDRRRFLGSLATGAAAIGLAGLPAPGDLHAGEISSLTNPEDPEEMFKKIKGKRRIVFDVTQPHEIFPFLWPRVFLLTNEATGSPDKDCGVVVVLRHAAIPYAFEDRLWEKYKFGEMFKANDPDTKTAALRNPFWKPKPGAFMIPGIGEVAIGINELQKGGVLFCVCDAAMTVYSTVAAGSMNQNAADVKKDWETGLLPDITIVPSGVWALGRAQEKGCGYIFAG